MSKFMECPNCKEIELPCPDGGECEHCGIPAYFERRSDIEYWHWTYHHDWTVDTSRPVVRLVCWLHRLCDAFIAAGRLPATNTGPK